WGGHGPDAAATPGHSPWSTNRSTEREWSCPICQDAHEDAAYAMPCGHQFCLGCIMHWADRKPACPVCGRTILIVKFSVREEDDYLQCLVTPSGVLSEPHSQAGRASSHLARNNPHCLVSSLPSSSQGTLSPAEQGVMTFSESKHHFVGITRVLWLITALRAD
uniref:RING-type E3 ubiquitin transferase n=1 Tax=Malurus cyaneus samueli TaxID=2593467 RepID=A0A8C5UJI4_9PASS